MKPTPKKEKKKRAPFFGKRLFWCAAALTIAFSLAAALLFGPGQNVAARVNGLPIYRQELAMYAAERKAALAAEFAAQQGLESFGSAFWDTEYGGQTPREALLNAALEDAVRAKVIQQQAALRGITAPADFREVEAALEQENQARSAKEGLSAYGPSSMSLYEYNAYLMAQTENDLKTALLNGELAPTEEEQRAAFYTLPETLRYTGYEATGWQISTFGEGGNWRQFLQQQLEKATPEEAVAALQAEYPGIACLPFSMVSGEVHREDIYRQSLQEVLYPARAGQLLAGIEEGEYFLVGWKAGGELLTYEQAPGLGRNKYINDTFEAFVHQKTEEAEVVVKSSAIKAIVV
ncbi:MAG: hypothetical protein ACK5L3_06280 [Oscillospiraceae bacterium]